MDAEKAERKKERKVVHLISAAHFFSHFYLLALPPLFLAMKEDLHLTFTELGVIVSVYAVGSFSGQYPMGVLADKYGPRWILILGMLTVSSVFVLMGLIPIYWVMVGLALIAGWGDSVFHPADFVVLTASVAPKRSGRAYATHAFAGFAGFAAAPVVVDSLRVASSWQNALVIAGVLGLIMTLILLFNKDLLIGEDEAPHAEAKNQQASQSMGVMEFIKFPPILILFFFYIAVALAGNGVQQFSPSALPDMYGIELSTANHVLFIYMAAISAGVLVGGYIADKVQRLELVASVGYLAGIIMTVIVALNFLPFLWAAVALIIAGFMTGIVMPSRDVLVRAVTPKGNAGKAFGFVNSGFGFGGMVGPIIFGRIMDSGEITGIYYGAAVFMFFAIVTALAAGRYARTSTAAQPAE
ncbi:MAG: MFS transporter [Rhodospirillaceae bacterium]|jgi:MFS transporter, FSR family, fosmidomycin resistance protein|nr:MFS transporter [Rhodospirillaceae bacterium]MBT4588716.1 MFS transporter [Rhodospirillaceae bacterium]MBT4940600.1 MFS transporter [Rhodospirillaceae bacterium]MBT7265610.1 MFS transporter [Rhodospirillaceae bacterium]